jgi:hypothetical protein
MATAPSYIIDSLGQAITNEQNNPLTTPGSPYYTGPGGAFAPVDWGASYDWNNPLGSEGIEQPILTAQGTPNPASSIGASMAQGATTQQTPFQTALGALQSSVPALAAGSVLNDAQQAFHLPSLTDVVVILAGIVLLAGAVFGFKSIQTTVVSGVRKGADLATA